jgi:hypothetical protein
MAPDETAERIAAAFHESYERQAPDHGYETREDSAKPWEEVPEHNRALMAAVVADLIDRRVIEPGPEAHGGAAGYTRDQLRGSAGPVKLGDEYPPPGSLVGQPPTAGEGA